MSMSTSVSAKQYLEKRLNELMIHDVSDLMVYINTSEQIIGDKMLVDAFKTMAKDGDKVLVDAFKTMAKDSDMTLFCSLPPLLTARMCIKEPINLSVSSQGDGLYVNPHQKSYGNKEERWLEVISWEPKAFVYHNFLTNEECEHLISLARPHMVRSKVSDAINGGGLESSSRTSTGTFFSKKRDKIVAEIEKRISDFTFIPIENGERLQVIHYEAGQKFEPHFDGFQRIATVLMYLSDVEEGGETVFPVARQNNRIKKISVSPKKRDALLFWNMRPDGYVDPSSMHGGSPVIKGHMWAATKWLHGCKYP